MKKTLVALIIGTAVLLTLLPRSRSTLGKTPVVAQFPAAGVTFNTASVLAVQGCGSTASVYPDAYNQSGFSAAYSNASGWHNIGKMIEFVGLDNGDLVSISRYPNVCPMPAFDWGFYQFNPCGNLGGPVTQTMGNNVASQLYRVVSVCQCPNNAHGSLVPVWHANGICGE